MVYNRNETGWRVVVVAGSNILCYDLENCIRIRNSYVAVLFSQDYRVNPLERFYICRFASSLSPSPSSLCKLPHNAWKVIVRNPVTTTVLIVLGTKQIDDMHFHRDFCVEAYFPLQQRKPMFCNQKQKYQKLTKFVKLWPRPHILWRFWGGVQACFIATKLVTQLGNLVFTKPFRNFDACCRWFSAFWADKGIIWYRWVW